MNRLIGERRGNVRLDTLAAGVMCLYAVLMYCGYINGVLASIQSMSLYVIVGMAFLMTILHRQLRLYSYLMWYGGFILYAFISVVYANSPDKVLSSLYGMIVVFLLAFSLSQILRNEKRIELLLRCFIAGSVILMLYMIATGKLSTETEVAGRLGGNLTGNTNVFASLFMFAAYASVYFIGASKKFNVKILYILTFTIQTYALVLAGGRKYILMPFIVFYVMLLLRNDSRGRKHIIKNTIIIFVGISVLLYALMNVSFLYENVGYRFESYINYVLGITTVADGSTMEREWMSTTAFNLWLESPIIGHGLNMFSVLGGFGVYCHRNYLELLCNHGLVGFIIYYSYWVYLFVKLLKLKNYSIMKLFMISVMVSFLIFDYGAVTYTMPQLQFFLLMANMYIDFTRRERIT